jgi:hypothetical protein
MAAVPRFKNVPDDWKHPLGPYRQAPAENGGEWWLVNPFTGNTPWANEGAVIATDPPADFVAVCGPRPHREAPFYGEWNKNLDAWTGVEFPDWISKQQIDEATAKFEAWGMGKPVCYRGPYGYIVRWPETKHYEFEGEARAAYVTSTDWKIAEFQNFLRNKGLAVDKPHPFLPALPQ